MSHCGLLHLSRLQRRIEGAKGADSVKSAGTADASAPVHAAVDLGRSGSAVGKGVRIRTTVVDRANDQALAKVYKELEGCVAAGHQAYWICPFVEGVASNKSNNKISSEVTGSNNEVRKNKRGLDEAGCAAAVAAFKDLQDKLPGIRQVTSVARMASQLLWIYSVPMSHMVSVFIAVLTVGKCKCAESMLSSTARRLVWIRVSASLLSPSVGRPRELLVYTTWRLKIGV